MLCKAPNPSMEMELVGLAESKLEGDNRAGIHLTPRQLSKFIRDEKPPGDICLFTDCRGSLENSSV